jgi:hypothetical protein
MAYNFLLLDRTLYTKGRGDVSCIGQASEVFLYLVCLDALETSAAGVIDVTIFWAMFASASGTKQSCLDLALGSWSDEVGPVCILPAWVECH